MLRNLSSASTACLLFDARVSCGSRFRSCKQVQILSKPKERKHSPNMAAKSTLALCFLLAGGKGFFYFIFAYSAVELVHDHSVYS